MSTLEEYLKDFEDGNKFIPAVVGYLIKDNKILLGLRKEVSLGLGLNLIAGIGGKVGDSPEIANETDEEAFVRESQEEIGVKPLKFKHCGRVRFIFPHKPKWSQSVEIYLCTEWEGEPIETNAIKPDWYTINKIPFDQMWKDNSFWLPKVLAGEKIDAVFLYGEDGKVADYKFEA